MKQSQEEYRNWSESIHDLPLFLKWWWIDTVTGGNWDAVFSYSQNGGIRGAFPYSQQSFAKIFSVIKMPKQTQFLGPWIVNPNDLTKQKKHSYHKEVLHELIVQLPKVSFFKQRIHLSHQNWLPFFWNNYEQTTNYTYRLDLGKSMEQIESELARKTRSDIRRASKKLKCVESNNIEEFYLMNSKTFERQKINVPYSLAFVSALYKEISIRKCGKIYKAIDDDGIQHAAISIVWDNKSAYYLWGGADPKYRSSNASSLLLWRAIQNSHEHLEYFDFEGSMIKPIERSFASFGADQTPYFTISKSSNTFNLLEALRRYK